MRRSGWENVALLALVAAAGCGSEAATITVEVTTGLETDAMTRDPAVTRVDVNARSVEGDVDVTASAAPGGELDLGELPAARLYTFEVTGVDAAGTAVLRGRSLGIELSTVGAWSVLPIFAQRTGSWGRPGGEMARAHVDAPAAALAERYLFTTGGTEAANLVGATEPVASDFYDLLGLAPAVSNASPLLARSLVTRGTAALEIGDSGASWVDFEAGTIDDLGLPAGLASFGDLAGGRTIEAADGVSFVVGATRAAGPTRAVLEVAADGTVAARALGRARAGAAAAWVEGVGLVVAGGSDEAPGVEVLASGASAFADGPFPADPATGAGAVVVAEATLALVGGALGAGPAPTRTLALSCLTGCAATEVDLPLPELGRDVVAYSLGTGRAIAVGTESTPEAMVRVFLVDLAGPSAIEVPLREPRRGATALPAPNGTLALIGGMRADMTPALQVELFFPP